MKRYRFIGGFILVSLLFGFSLASAQPEVGLAYQRTSTHPSQGISIYGSYISDGTGAPLRLGARIDAAYERERGHFQGVLAKTREQAFRVGLTPIVRHTINPVEFYGGLGGGAEFFHRKLVHDDTLPDIAYSERNKHDIGLFVEGLIGSRFQLHSLILPFLEYRLLRTWHSEEVFTEARAPVRRTSSSLRIGLSIRL